MKIVDRLICKTREKTNPWFAEYRRNRLNRTDFSIISHNCWAGSVYRYFGLQYSSPTEGLYFFPEDYIKFVSRLRHYLTSDIQFIEARDSRHSHELAEKGEMSVPVGVIDDIEVIFLHYPTSEEAKEKWIRRSARVNWDNLFIKFSQMNGCSQDALQQFDDLPFANKICFTASLMPQLKCASFFKGFEDSSQGILNDTDRFDKSFNLTRWLNREPVPYELG